MRPSDAFVDGPVVSLASRALAIALGRGAELVLAELRADNALLTLPAEDVNTLLELAAHGRARARVPVSVQTEIATTASGNGATVTTMTATEAGAILAVGPRRVGQLRQSGELPGEQDAVGGWRYRRRDVEALASKRGASSREKTGGTTNG